VTEAKGKIATRAAILEAAKKLFAAKGFDAATESVASPEAGRRHVPSVHSIEPSFDGRSACAQSAAERKSANVIPNFIVLFLFVCTASLPSTPKSAMPSKNLQPLLNNPWIHFC